MVFDIIFTRKKPDQSPAEWIKIAIYRGKGKKITFCYGFADEKTQKHLSQGNSLEISCWWGLD
jgi:hypothetical protein